MVLWKIIKREPIGIISLLLISMLFTLYVYDRLSYHPELDLVIGDETLEELTFSEEPIILRSIPSFNVFLLIRNKGRKESFMRRTVEYIISVKSQTMQGDARLRAVDQTSSFLASNTLYIPSKSDGNFYRFLISLDNFFSPFAAFESQAGEVEIIKEEGEWFVLPGFSQEKVLKMLDITLRFLENLHENGEVIDLVVIVSTLDGQRFVSNRLSIKPRNLIIELKEQRQKLFEADTLQLLPIPLGFIP